MEDQSHIKSKEIYFNGTAADRIFIPAYERIMQLYAFNYTAADIHSIINDEFQDAMINPIGIEQVRKIILHNKPQMDKVREEMGLSFRAEIQQQLKILHDKTASTENRLVSVYIKKIDECLDELQDLDPQEKDEEGNYKHTRRIFVLEEMISKFHNKCEKITGTSAIREIEIYRQKAQAKAEADAEGKNPLPAFRDANPGSGAFRPMLHDA